jgi:enoyl-CoA hydratase/carnithine racemase
MADYETVLYEERNGVAWVTLNRPEKYNAFNTKMTEELHAIWRSLRRNGDVRCAVLTGAGDKAFCTGIDRSEVNVDWPDEMQAGSTGGGDDGTGIASYASPLMHDDPGELIGPKTSDLWKPVIAAVNGMACGGAFYMLGEADFIISADHATYFDPHVDYGMAAVFEPIHMLQKMPFHEVMRMSLLGGAERMSAARAFQVGLVSEVVPAADLVEQATWAAETIASYPTLAVQATVRAVWSGQEMTRKQALDQGYALVAMGTTAAGLREGQERFESGKRTPWRLR